MMPLAGEPVSEPLPLVFPVLQDPHVITQHGRLLWGRPGGQEKWEKNEKGSLAGGGWGSVEKGEETPETMLSGFRESRGPMGATLDLKVSPSFSLLPSRQNEAGSGTGPFHAAAAVAGPGVGPGAGASDGCRSPGE